MVFSSLTFLLYFLPTLWLVYYLCPASFKNGVLLVASLFFYAWGEPVYLLLMLFSIMMNYAFGALIGRAKEAAVTDADNKLIRLHLGLAVAANLSLLGLFKYAGFFTGVLGHIVPVEEIEVALPIGISFYTFQALSYVVDVAGGGVKPQRNLLSFALYITMFPQLIAGPIVVYKEMQDQLGDHPVTSAKLRRGMWRFIIGLGKKVLLANPMGQLFTMISECGEWSFGFTWIGAAAFTLQIYYDFSGYSDMAMGLGEMFGFKFPVNFNAPYTAKSVTDFWRRWHITLSSWFRDYVYIPLGGNRGGVKKHIRNLLIVWLLTGFWHGAGWNFMLWGVYYGVLLVLEKYVWGSRIEAHPVIGHIYTMFIVIVGWVIFAFTDMGSMGRFLAGMFGAGGFSMTAGIAGAAGSVTMGRILSGYGVTFALCLIGVLKGTGRFLKNLYKKHAYITVAWLLAVLVLCLMALVHDSYNPFLYFRF